MHHVGLEPVMNSTSNGLGSLEYETGRAEERQERCEIPQPGGDTGGFGLIAAPILRRSTAFNVKSLTGSRAYRSAEAAHTLANTAHLRMSAHRRPLMKR